MILTVIKELTILDVISYIFDNNITRSFLYNEIEIIITV